MNQIGGEQAKVRTSLGANEPEGERARGEQARGEPAKGRKSQTQSDSSSVPASVLSQMKDVTIHRKTATFNVGKEVSTLRYKSVRVILITDVQTADASVCGSRSAGFLCGRGRIQSCFVTKFTDVD